MEPTRRTWTATALGVTLGAIAPIVGSVVPLIGVALLAGWVLSVQLVAVRSFRETAAMTTVEFDPERQYSRDTTAVAVTVTVERPKAAATTTLSVTCPTPPAADPIPAAERRLELKPGETRATTVFDVRIPTAGRFRLPEPVWELTDRFGLFTDSVSQGPTAELQFSESTNPAIHVGQGGTPTTLFGERLTNQSGSGLIPDRVRPYVPSDAANRIDWNTTARLGEPYVQEFDTETDRSVRLIVDHRTTLAVGSRQRTMVDYLRDIALGIVETVEQNGDRLALVTVGNDGFTNLVGPTQRAAGYETVRQRLYALQATPTNQPTSTVELGHPTSARRLMLDLDQATDEFSRTLRAFATSATSYVALADAAPLSKAVRHTQAATTSAQVTVILTDDTSRSELWDAVQRARQHSSHVFAVLTPRCLFEPNRPDTPSERYAQYRAFEQFRTQLDRLDSVTAVEVAPADRLAAVLDERQEPGRQSSTQPTSTSAQTVHSPFTIRGRSNG